MSYYSVERGTSLTHTGVKGMKWYQRNYQTADGKWTPLGLQRRREREGFGDGKDGLFKVRRKTKTEKEEARKAKRAAREEKRQAKAAAKQQKLDAKKQKVEAAKREDIDKAIAKGDYKYLSKHVSDLSTNDLLEAQKRISTMNTMRKAYNEINPPKEPLYKRIDNYANTTYNVVKKFQELTGLGPDKSKGKDQQSKSEKQPKQEKQSKQQSQSQPKQETSTDDILERATKLRDDIASRNTKSSSESSESESSPMSRKTEREQRSTNENYLDKLSSVANQYAAERAASVFQSTSKTKVSDLDNSSYGSYLEKIGSKYENERRAHYSTVKISDLSNDDYISFLGSVANQYEKERNR